MFNVIKSDFIKLKWSSWYKFLVLFSVLSISIISILLYSVIIRKFWVTWWVFWNILWLDENLSLFTNLLNVFYIFIFSILTDIVFWVDKWKWLILFTKNIRIKYFLSKIFVIFITIIFILFFVNLIVLFWIYFFNSWINFDIISIIFKEFLFKNLLFFISIVPLIILFSFLNLVWIRSIIISVIILFYFFFNLIFWNLIEKTDFKKYNNIIKNYTLIWNYNSILTSKNSDKSNLKTENIPEKYLNFEEIKKVEELTQKYNELVLFSDLFMDMDFMNWIDIKDKKVKEKFDILSQKYWVNPDNYPVLSAKYQDIYEKMWGYDEQFKIEQNLELYKNKVIKEYFVIYPNFLKILKDIFSMNLNFYVWLIHSIFLLLIWSIIIKRREVFN